MADTDLVVEAVDGEVVSLDKDSIAGFVKESAIVEND